MSYPDFDDLEEDQRMNFIIEASEELYSQGQLPYEVMHGDEQLVEEYEPVLRLARLNYESSFEDD